MGLTSFKHFYLNKYLIKPFSRNRYFLSYDFKHKALWYRTFKVASRTINHHFKHNSRENEYVYSSSVGYLPWMYKDFFKFAFVRHPTDRLISVWRDKVLDQNYFSFNNNEHQKMKDFDNFVSWVKTLDITNCDQHLRDQRSLIDLNNVDFVGRFERFQEDFAFVAKEIGLILNEVEHKNPSPKATPELSDRIKSDVKEIYFNDFNIFYPDSLV